MLTVAGSYVYVNNVYVYLFSYVYVYLFMLTVAGSYGVSADIGITVFCLC